MAAVPEVAPEKPAKTTPAKATPAKTTPAKTTSQPQYTTYTVKSGDTLGKIAKKHGTTVAAVKKANGLRSDMIKPGQKLKIPKK